MAVKKRLTPIALSHIRALSPGIKNMLALALSCSESTINRYIRDNGMNDTLTKEPALKILRRVTRLTDIELVEDIRASQN